MPQNVRVTDFTVSELLRKNEQGTVKLPSPTHIRVKAMLQSLGYKNEL